MIRNSRRVVALAIAGAVAIAPVITGCGAGESPQTAAPTQLTEGVNVSVPKDAKRALVDIRNMFVLGPANGVVTPAGAAVPLYATLINQEKKRPDKLVSVSSPAFGQAKLADNGVALPGGQAVSLKVLSGQTPPVVLQGTTQPLRGGETLQLTLKFEQAGDVTVSVPVVPQQGEYGTYGPVPSETPTPTPTPSGKSPSPSESPSG